MGSRSSSRSSASHGSDLNIIHFDTSASAAPRDRFSRRRLLAFAGAATAVGASGALGRVVGFDPTPVAIADSFDYNCIPFKHHTNYDCFGFCTTGNSCCTCRVNGDQCCCLCPGNCNPAIARAHCRNGAGMGQNNRGQCCCNSRC